MKIAKGETIYKKTKTGGPAPVKLKNNNKNGQMEEEDEELGGCKGEPVWPVDRVGGREGGGIPGVTLRQGAEAESQPPSSPFLRNCSSVHHVTCSLQWAYSSAAIIINTIKYIKSDFNSRGERDCNPDRKIKSSASYDQ